MILAAVRSVRSDCRPASTCFRMAAKVGRNQGTRLLTLDKVKSARQAELRVLLGLDWSFRFLTLVQLPLPSRRTSRSQMFAVSSALSSGGVAFEKCVRLPAGGVSITGANQLIGAYSDLGRFQHFDRSYFGWHVHHIVESQDLE